MKLIELFKAALVSEDKVDPIVVNSFAVRSGYIVHPEVCNKETLEFVQYHSRNYNATFYKVWDDVTNASAMELATNALLHYATTYGSNLNTEAKKFIYVPNMEPIEIPLYSYKVISKITPEELYEKCLNMITSGIALKDDTLDPVCSYIADYVKENNIEFDPLAISNKEAQAILCVKTGIYPNDPFSLLRVIVYNCTHNSMLIKDQVTLNKISWARFDMSVLTDSQLKMLSEIFYRFKPIFLHIRKQQGVNNKPIINKIRRYANQYHKPFKAGFWETVLDNKNYKVTREVANRVGELSNFKLVQLIQATKERIISTNVEGPQLYKVRNGKIFIKDKNYPMLSNEMYYWDTILEIFIEQLVENLKKKACTVKFPEHLTLTCPSSEKNFVGNIPFGSYFNMENHNFIGCYWRNEWGTTDFDLSAINKEGKMGWDAKYNDWGLVYSGDMTYADPEAAELLWCKKNCEDSLIYVSRYAGAADSKFEMFYGKFDNDPGDIDIRENGMIDPNNILLKEEVKSDSREKMIGAIFNNKMYIMDARTGEGRVSVRGSHMDGLMNSIKKKLMCHISLKNILLMAGFKERKRDTKNNPIELDLTNLNKDTLIELFS